MHDFLNAKTMARTLRQALAERHVQLTHSDCLELTAKQFGFANWNMLSARIDAATGDDKALLLPDGWFVTGNTRQENYHIGLDASSPGTATIKCRHDRSARAKCHPAEIGCMMQSIVADGYRGGRIRLTASLKTTDADLGTIWMRIDGEEGVLRFDNMMERSSNGPLEATADWTSREIVLDAPEAAASIHYGFFLKGHGRVSSRDFRLELVDATVATTDLPSSAARKSHLPKPTNLAFSKSVGTAA